MFDLEPEEARLLLNVALMATGANRFRSAARIFAALERYRPDAPSVAVGEAIALIRAHDFARCVEFVDGTLRRFPGNAMLLAFKGMALLRMGRDEEARVPLGAAAAQTEDGAAAQLAGDMLKDLESGSKGWK